MKKETKEYLEIAEENLKIAKKSFEIGLHRSACFWSQQSAELALKSFLIEKDVFNPKKHRTHNLRFLLLECAKVESKFFELSNENIDKLTSHATMTRYDLDFVKSVDEKRAKEAIKTAENVVSFVIKLLE